MQTVSVTSANRDAVVADAARRLLAGGVVIIPTDTVYGIAAHPSHPEASARICSIKGRPTGKPIALLAADTDAVRNFGGCLTPTAERLAATFWPGALTLVLPCRDGDEGFRVPAHDLTRALLAACGGVLRVTSANLSGAMPAVHAAQVLAESGLEADLLIDDGPSPGGIASTVVRVTGADWSVLRAGAISAQQLADALIPEKMKLLKKTGVFVLGVLFFVVALVGVGIVVQATAGFILGWAYASGYIYTMGGLIAALPLLAILHHRLWKTSWLETILQLVLGVACFAHFF